MNKVKVNLFRVSRWGLSLVALSLFVLLLSCVVVVREIIRKTQHLLVTTLH